MAKIKKIDDELKLASQGVKTATDNFNNMSYDNFKQGSMYQGLQKSYSQQGQQAMKDTLGQVAARTGGMASSYATTAANQSYNNYMQQLEDVARAMYNDEYSKARDKVSLAQNEYDRLYGEKRDAISDQRYEDEQAYLKGRDELSDQRYNTEREEARVANDAYYGNALDYKTYKANGGTLSEQAYNSIVAAAKGKYTDDHWEQTNAENANAEADADALIESYIHNGSWQWGDWNNDGIKDNNDEDYADEFFAGSSQGENYWKNIHDKHKEDSKIKGYVYKDNAEGAANIANALINSASLSLSKKDQDNFDYIYGEGAYEGIQSMIKEIPPLDRYSPEQFLTEMEQWIEKFSQVSAKITDSFIIDVLERVSPDKADAFLHPEKRWTPSRYDEKMNPVYVNG
jgi:hypothetical protein